MGPLSYSADPPGSFEIRIVAVANDLLSRAGLADLLQRVPGLEVVAQAASGDELRAAVSAYQPDALVWDIGWSDEQNAWQERVNAQAERGMAVVALLSDSGQASEAWACGARAVLSREAGPEKIAAAVRAVRAELLAAEPDYFQSPHAEFDPPDQSLTQREFEVLDLLAEGLSNRAIAYRLEISEHTVKFHVNGILRKLGAQSRTEAVVRATRMGLLLL